MKEDLKITEWIRDRLGWTSFKEFFKKDVPHHKHSFWYYWGWLTIACLLIQVITGVLLLFYYKPNVEEAHASIQYIMSSVQFGSLIRSLHSWGADLFIVCMFVHMFSVFFIKAYRRPRELLWMSGVLMFLIAMGFGFTGYVLPWNESSYFGTIVTLAETEKFPIIGSMLSGFLKSGNHVSSMTLTKMFAVHTGLLPLLTIIFLGLHLYLNKVYQYSIPIGINNVNKTLNSYKDFFYRASIAWLILLALTVTLALLLPAGSGKAFDIYNLTAPPEGIHPDWYFMFLFQTLKSETIIPPAVTVAIILILFLFWLIVPLLDKNASLEKKSPAFTLIGFLILIYIVIMTFFAYKGVGEI